MKPITTVYINDEEISLPTKWEICGECRGEGSVSSIPGAFTATDLDEWFGNSDEREEFLGEYTKKGGMYDKPCPDCKGRGSVQVVDENRLDPITLRVYQMTQAEAYADWATEQAERAMGA